MLTSRRGFLGLLAAPAIVRVASIMPLSVIEPFTTANMDFRVTITPSQLIVPPPLERLALDSAKFRAILMPHLRKHFDDEFDRVFARAS
jgi:hypothetical protein